jgi:hypothetical protein
MPERSLFVDFMYAVTVGAALPRIDENALHFNSPKLWGVGFLVAVFLEDFFLYHAKVVPHLSDVLKARGFILAMLIVATWYLSQAAFPTNPILFLSCFGLFFLLKLLGGVLMTKTKYPSRVDAIFALPVVASIFLIALSGCIGFADHAERMLYFLFPIWVLTIAIWWTEDKAVERAAQGNGTPA